jgi:hypothetical protein
MSQVRSLNIVGLRTVIDFLTVHFLIFLPLLIIISLFEYWKLVVIVVGSIYLLFVCLLINSVIVTPYESIGLKKRRFALLFYFPLMKLILESLAWTGACVQFFKTISRGRKIIDPAWSIPRDYDI